MIPSENDLPMGFVAGIAANYRIERKIGQGGMAMVFLATDLRHSRSVAIKVLHPMIASAIGRRRFLREIETVARLTHPNILPLHDSGDADGVLYYVMPFVEGQSLRDLLMSSPLLPVDLALRITLQVATALQYAHEQGVIHRDIKPANILIQSGQAILSDFGIAQAQSTKISEHLTTEPANIGTPAYASPEQISGTHQISSRSDVYSLAIVLHEMLAGSRPPRIDTVNGRSERAKVSTLRRAVDGEQLPERLDSALACALEVDPANRFKSVKDFMAALHGRATARSRMPSLILGSLLTILGVSLAWSWNLAKAPNVAGIVPNRIVVMPFTNQTADSTLDVFGRLAADWITSGLQRTEVVDVVPSVIAVQVSRDFLRQNPTSPEVDTRQISQATNAGVVVTGRVYAEGPDLVINAEVTDAQSSKLIASTGPIQVKANDRRKALILVNSMVMGHLAMSVNRDIRMSTARRGSVPQYEAYVEFAKGTDFYSENKAPQAIGHFLKAYSIDSTFVSALLMASIARSNTQDYRGADSLLREAARYQNQFSLYDRLWYEYRRNLVSGNRPEALANVRQLHDMSPGTKATYNLAVEAMQNGFLDDARNALLSLSPTNGPMEHWAPYWDILTRVHHLSREFRKERAAANRAFAQYPDRPYIANVVVRSLAAYGREAEILKLLDSVHSMPDDPTGLTANAIAMDAAVELRAHGHRQAAQRLVKRLLVRMDSLSDSARALTGNRFLRARALYELGEWSGAQRIADSLTRATKVSNYDMLALAGTSAWRAGDSASTNLVLERLNSTPTELTAGNVSFALARIYSVKGDQSRATAALRRSIDEGKAYGFWGHVDPDFESISQNAEFQKVIRPKP